jgi:hypothetical protein
LKKVFMLLPVAIDPSFWIPQLTTRHSLWHPDKRRVRMQEPAEPYSRGVSKTGKFMGLLAL